MPTYNGTTGNDNISGSKNADNLYGFEGNDTLNGRQGNDNLYGGAGDDILRGFNGNDNYFWSIGDGNDTIDDNKNTNSLNLMGAISADDLSFSVHVSGGYNITIGSESIRSSGNGDLATINLDNGFTLDMANSEFGGTGADTLTGNANNNLLMGGSGNDTYEFSGGTDIVEDTAGTDRILLGVGVTQSDVTYHMGDNGKDLIVSVKNVGVLVIKGQLDNASIETVEFADGTIVDLVEMFSGISSPPPTFDRTGSDEGTHFAGLRNNYVGEDSIDGGGGDDDIFGFGGNDVLNGGAGNDKLDGGNGDDQLFGGTGDDRIDGGNGNDVINGGDGSDTLYADDGDDVLLAGAGDDDVYGGNGNDVIDGGSGADHIDGGTGNDVINAGDDGDELFGQDGSDTLNGEGGRDVLYGGADNDILNGGGEVDRMYGGTGDDVLNGGLGFDRLYGGDGADTFVFENIADSAGRGYELVYDFDQGEGDVLNLSDMLSGYDALTDDINDFVSFYASRGDAVMFVDTDGAGGARHVSVAKLYGNASLNGIDVQTMIDAGEIII